MALLGAVVAFGLCAAHRGRVRLLLGVLVCYAIAYALPPHTMSRFMTIAEELQHGGTLSGRRIFWERAAALVAEHPLRGLGAGTGEAVLWLGSHNAVSHNILVGLALEGGAVSVLLFYGALLCSLPRVWRCVPAERTFLVSLCVAWLVGTCSVSWEFHMVTWFIFGLLVSIVPQRPQVVSDRFPVEVGWVRTVRRRMACSGHGSVLGACDPMRDLGR